jgi:hypothetical protein
MKNEIIETFLSPYKKESRLLKSFELVGNKGIATFMANSDFYCITQEPVHHFTAVELQVCLNQLIYVYLAHLGIYGENFNISTKEDFIKTLNSNNFITEQITHFKKEIDSSQIIHGEIEMLKSKKIGKMKFMECQFQFGKQCFGSVKLAHRDD